MGEAAAIYNRAIQSRESVHEPTKIDATSARESEWERYEEQEARWPQSSRENGGDRERYQALESV